jgi:cyclopropane fatty-acyl-phospholipid synthase-like methyltransferase
VNSQTVINCYDLLGLSLLCGIEDYTDGIYKGTPSTAYDDAQRRQHDYLLGQLGVTAGYRLLDVGCGTGSLLRRAKKYGAHATGITISPRQVAIGREQGLDVRLMDYMTIARDFAGEFDGIVANGSIEHFCQPEQANRGLQDSIYRAMFEIFDRALRRNSPSRKVATTVIHFRDKHVPPKMLIRSPIAQIMDRTGFHFSILHRACGGYYPVKDQLARCAFPRFKLVAEQDGTEDYRFTSEDWLRKVHTALRTNADFRSKLGAHFLKRPLHTAYFTLTFLGAESWPWQFRGEQPPTTLYRQTWQAS